MDKVLVVAPVRNRMWILGDYLHGLYNLDYSREDISFHFLLNDSYDLSEEILRKWKQQRQREYRYIRISNMELGNLPDIGEAGLGREGSRRGNYETFAFLRNTLLSAARLDREIKYIFSVDSDILVKPDCLKNLIATGKDIVAALIENGKNAYNFLPFSGDRSVIPKGLQEVRLTGACYLISEKVFRNDEIKYISFNTGEDEGFCVSARSEGIRSYILPDMQKHILDRRQE